MSTSSPLSVVWQKTLKSAISCTGIGLHSGKRVEMTLVPAGPGTGIRFRRVDLDGPAIEARHDNVSNTLMNTSLANHHGRGVATIEHLMAAISGLAIDNLLIELDGGEVPAMDGKLPEGASESNWIQTNKRDGWFVLFRFYGPEKPYYDRSWKLNDFEKIK